MTTIHKIIRDQQAAYKAGYDDGFYRRPRTQTSNAYLGGFRSGTLAAAEGWEYGE